MNLSQGILSEHCGESSRAVMDLVRGTLKSTSDVEDFYLFLQQRDENSLCSLPDLLERCTNVKCELCYRRVYHYISSHPSFIDGVIPLEFLGPDPLQVISRCAVCEPRAVFRPGFLSGVHDSIEANHFIPVQPRYQLSTFMANLKTVLDLAVGVRASGKDITELESKTDEQNQYIGMMVDCVTEFICAVIKFESARPLRAEPNVHVRALVDAFERLGLNLFMSCHKVRERLDRSGVPSVLGISMTQYLSRYRRDASDAQFKTALLSLHILNLQRVEAFRTFHSEACDQIVVFEATYIHDMTRLMKYVDQDDFASPLLDTPMKILLISQLEMGLGPLIQRGAEFTQGPYPSMVQELAMLELRASKIQQGHVEVWTRTKDRVLDQLLPVGFPMTETLRAEIQTASANAVGICVEAVKAYTAELNMSAPLIDAMMRSNPLEGFKMRYLLRASNMKMLFEFTFGLRHLCALASFLHDYLPVMQEQVCGTDAHVEMFVHDLVLESHIRDLLSAYKRYSSERAFKSILSDHELLGTAKNRVRTSAKKSKPPKQKKMDEQMTPSTARTPPLGQEASSAATVTPPFVEVEDFDSGWEEVRSKKKSPHETSKEQQAPPKKKNERTRGKSDAQTEKKQSSTKSFRNSHIATTHTTIRSSADRNRVRAPSPNPNRPEPVEPEPAPEPTRPSEPAREFVVHEPEPEPERPSEPEPPVVPDLKSDFISEPVRVAEAPLETVRPEQQPEQPKRQRRRGGGGAKRSPTAPEPAPILNDILFARGDVPVDPLVLASYAASQVSAPVPMLAQQVVAVPARMFGGVLSMDYASVPFMTFPRVYV